MTEYLHREHVNPIGAEPYIDTSDNRHWTATQITDENCPQYGGDQTMIGWWWVEPTDGSAPGRPITPAAIGYDYIPVD